MITPPFEATRFVGRQRELSEVRQALSSGRLVTLVGVGGAGKTRLAQRLLQTTDRGFSAVWGVELADVLDPAAVPGAVNDALGLQTRPGQDPSVALADLVGDRSVLLLLDNCEQVLDACSALVVGLLTRCPRLRVLTTSRQPLGVTGERVYAVPPLGMPASATGIPLAELAEYESVGLFLDRARTVLPGFTLTAENAEAVTQVCLALDGLPLALELAAARIRVLTPEAILERLRDRFQLLNRGFAGRPARQQTLEASVDWSHDLCSAEERLLWARLSVFVGGFGLDAAETVCAGPDLAGSEILDVLSDLIDKSLVARDAGDGLHYRMLETIRQYGAASLEASGETALYQGRHRDWYLAQALRLGAEWTGPTQARRVAQWRRDHANVRQVLEQTATRPESAPTALVLVMALEGFWLVTGLLAEARHWLELGLSHDVGQPSVRAGAYSMCAYIGSIQSDPGYAAASLVRARALLAGSQDPLSLGYLAFASASVALFGGNMTGALAEVEHSIGLLETAGEVNHVAMGLVISGFCHTSLGHPEEAAAAKAACLAVTEPTGELYARSLALWSLGLDARDRGRLDEATELEMRALTMKAALRDHPGVAVVLEALASIAAARGEAARSATLLGAAGAIWQFVLVHPVAAPFIAAERARGEAHARRSIADPAFEAAYRRGRKMTLDAAVQFALGDVAASAAAPAEPTPSVAGSRLTSRETEVAELVGQGLTNQEIADRLFISVRTAQGHVENILRKLGFGSRTQVAAWVAGRATGSSDRSAARAAR